MAEACVDKPTKLELVIPSIVFFCIATAAPLLVLVGSCVLLGLAATCLRNNADISVEGGECVLCIDCDSTGTPLLVKDESRIGLFCRYPNVPENETAVTGCTVGSAVLVAVNGPGVILATVILVLVIICALFSIGGACQAAGAQEKREMKDERLPVPMMRQSRVIGGNLTSSSHTPSVLEVGT